MALKPLTIKVTAGIVGVGTTGFIGHQTYKALQNKQEETIKESNRDRLTSEKYKLLVKEATNDNTWQAILDSYKEVIKSKTNLAFVDFDGNDKEGQKALDTLKTKCEEALNSKDETLLNKARKWCIIPITVEKALEGRKILVVSKDEDVKDKEAWDKKVAAYTAAGNTNKIPNLTFTGGPITTEKVSQTNRESFKDACKALNEKKSYAGDYEEAIDKAKEWCSIEQSGS